MKNQSELKEKNFRQSNSLFPQFNTVAHQLKAHNSLHLNLFWNAGKNGTVYAVLYHHMSIPWWEVQLKLIMPSSFDYYVYKPRRKAMKLAATDFFFL